MVEVPGLPAQGQRASAQGQVGSVAHGLVGVVNLKKDGARISRLAVWGYLKPVGGRG